MGKEVRGVPETPALSGDGADRRIGAYLARQRELRGISLDELAALTRIPRRSLERLETGAFDRDPDGFARGFVRTVAAALGLDPQETVMRLLQEPAAADAAEERRDRARRAVWIGGAVLGLLIGLAVWRLVAGNPEPAAISNEGPPVVFRRDAVRALAEEVPGYKARPGGEPGEPVDSARGEHPD